MIASYWLSYLFLYLLPELLLSNILCIWSNFWICYYFCIVSINCFLFKDNLIILLLLIAINFDNAFIMIPDISCFSRLFSLLRSPASERLFIGLPRMIDGVTTVHEPGESIYMPSDVLLHILGFVSRGDVSSCSSKLCRRLAGSFMNYLRWVRACEIICWQLFHVWESACPPRMCSLN